MNEAQLNRIHFNYRKPHSNYRHFVDVEDVKTVLRRLPYEVCERLKAVHLNNRSRGGRVLGYTTTRGRREVSLCSLPARMTVRGALRFPHTPEMFGGTQTGQWPTLAVRRFMLYGVLLHEVGHLQLVREKGRGPQRKFAREPLAEAFAGVWGPEIWATPIEHTDPAHHPPSEEELARVREDWPQAHADYRKGLVCESNGQQKQALLHFDQALRRYPNHALALEAMGVLLYSTAECTQRAAVFLERAVACDRLLHDAQLFLALALLEQGQRERADAHFAQALRLSRLEGAMKAMYGMALADAGAVEDGRALLVIGVKKDRSSLARRYHQVFVDRYGALPGVAKRGITPYTDGPIIKLRAGRTNKGLVVHHWKPRAPLQGEGDWLR